VPAFNFSFLRQTTAYINSFDIVELKGCYCYY